MINVPVPETTADLPDFVAAVRAIVEEMLAETPRSFFGLDEVDSTTIDTGETVVWNGTAVVGAEVVAVNLTDPQPGDRLEFDGTHWVNVSP